MSKGYFIFNGTKSSDFNLYTAGSGTYNSPERDVTEYSIPGRNGVLVKDNGRYTNAEVVYTILLKDNFTTTVFDVKAWLLSATGYCRLEDSFNPLYYRMARFSGSVDWTISELMRYGYCDVTFSCRPEVYLKTGETAVTLTASGSVTNPTLFASKPLIRVYGTGAGTVTIGNQVITISAVDTYVDIDSDVQDCYKGVENCNANVSLGSYGFPVFESGSTGISFSGLITKLEVYPRWWTL